jgi:hypothetical protein
LCEKKTPIATGTGREARASYWHGERCGCRSRGEEPLRGGGCRTGGALGVERGPQATRFVNAVVSAGLGGHAACPAGSSAVPAVDLQGIHRATARDYFYAVISAGLGWYRYRYHKVTGLQGRHKATGLQGRGRAKTSYVLLVAFRRLAVCSAEAGAGFHPHTEPRSTQSCVEQRNITYNGAGRQRSVFIAVVSAGLGAATDELVVQGGR